MLSRVIKYLIVLFFSVILSTEAIHAITIDGTYQGPRLTGIPLGGIGAGCFNFKPNGTYSSDYCYRRVSTGTEPDIMVYTNAGGTKWSTNALTVSNGIDITYTGFWPKVTNEYKHQSMPIELTLEAFSPLYPGANKDCSLPLAFFRFRVNNPTNSAIDAAIALKNGANSAVIVESGKVKGINSNAIVVMVKSDGEAEITSGANVSDFTDDGKLGTGPGGILAAKVTLQPSEERILTFILAWDTYGNTKGYYKNHYGTVRQVADYGYENAEALKGKVDNWHNKILNSNLPDWYKDVLINNCHVLNATYRWDQDGYALGMESVTHCQVDCFDQRFYGSIIIPLFAPDLEYTIMKEYAVTQQADGHIYYAIGGNYIASKNDVNSQFAMVLLRDYMWTGEDRFLTDMYDVAIKSLECNKNDDADNDVLPDNNFTTFDQPKYSGWMPPESEYCSHIWLCGLKAGMKMAELNNDPDEVNRLQGWFNQASASFEKKAGQGGYWDNTTVGPTGLRGFYTGSNDIVSNQSKGSASWASQIAGQWYADFLQIGLLNPQGRIDSAIAYVEALNPGADGRGYYLAILPDKSNWFGKQPGGNACGEQWPWFPPAHFGTPAISQGFPDIGMKCIKSNWRSNFAGELSSVGKIPWNSPVFMMVNGSNNPNDWGRYRYCNPPGVFTSLNAITGFYINVANKKLWIKPQIPSEMDGKLVKAPLINPKSCGTLDYSTGSSILQHITVAFDSDMSFFTITLQDKNTEVDPIYVFTNKGGSPVACTFERKGSGKTAEIVISFSSELTINQSGVEIIVSDNEVTMCKSVNTAMQTRITTISVNRGTIRLPRYCRPNDIVEIYNLQGRLLAKDISSRILRNSNLKLSNGIHICKIVPVEHKE